MRSVRVLLIAVLSFASGRVINTAGQTHPQAKVEGIDIVLLSQSMNGLAQLWEPEVARRYPGAVMLVCHGSDTNGDWYMHPDVDHGATGEDAPARLVKEEVLKAQIRFPGRMIVLICCNPGGYDLDLPLVAYAKSSVWVIPDRNMLPRVRENPEYVGNIFEFTERTDLP